MNSADTVVLVHGAWHDARCWDVVLPLLEASGHRVVAVDLPGRGDPESVGTFGLTDFAARVVETVRAVGGVVTLVGHSLGGMAVSAAAEQVPELVGGLLYAAAFVPGDGQAVGDLATTPEFASSMVARHQVVDPATGTVRFPAEAAVETFYAEVPPALAREAAGRLVPESLSVMAQPVTQSAAGIGRVRRGYLECTRDRTVPVAAQRVMYRAAGIDTVFTLDTDHSPFLSQPSEFVAVVDRFTAAVATA